MEIHCDNPHHDGGVGYCIHCHHRKVRDLELQVGALSEAITRFVGVYMTSSIRGSTRVYKAMEELAAKHEEIIGKDVESRKDDTAPLTEVITSADLVGALKPDSDVCRGCHVRIRAGKQLCDVCFRAGVKVDS